MVAQVKLNRQNDNGDVVQVKLERNGGTETLMTWVNKKKGLAVGSRITLKEDKNVLWTVTEMYNESRSKLLHTHWNNNI